MFSSAFACVARLNQYYRFVVAAAAAAAVVKLPLMADPAPCGTICLASHDMFLSPFYCICIELIFVVEV